MGFKMVKITYIIYNFLKKMMHKINLNKNKKINSAIRNLFEFLALKLITLYFLFSNVKTNDDGYEKLIISLTSFPKRIDIVHTTIKSLLRQDYENFEIYLWLSYDEFPNGHSDLPKKLLKLLKYKFKIEFVNENLKPHNKYYYAMKNFVNDIIVTVDDDVIYPNNTVSNLYKKHLEYKDAIICNRGHIIIHDNNRIAKYKEWLQNPSINEIALIKLFPTGVGGVLYPPNLLHKDLLNINLIKETCLLADDLWLYTMRIINNIKAIKISNAPKFLITLSGSQKTALRMLNVLEDKNDIQFLNIQKHYNILKILKDSNEGGI
jgi:hypothetical protein